MESTHIFNYLLNNSDTIQAAWANIISANSSEPDEILKEDLETFFGDKIDLFDGLIISFLRGKKEKKREFILLLTKTETYVKNNEITDLVITFNIAVNKLQFEENLSLTCKKINSFLSTKIDSQMLILSCINDYKSLLNDITEINTDFQQEWIEKQLNIPGIAGTTIFINLVSRAINPRLKRSVIINITSDSKFGFVIKGPEGKNYFNAANAEFLTNLDNQPPTK